MNPLGGIQLGRFRRVLRLGMLAGLLLFIGTGCLDIREEIKLTGKNKELEGIGRNWGQAFFDLSPTRRRGK